MNIYSPKNIALLCEKHGFSFKKQYGQNFLINEGVPERIALCAAEFFAGKSGKKCCVEIGPGIGSLTLKLAENFDSVVSLEVDSSLEEMLGDVTAHCGNLRVIYADALKTDLSALCAESFGNEKAVLCANLPYSVTSEAIMHVLKSECFSDTVVMIQKEVARRLCAAPGSPEYGSITAAASYFASIKPLFDVAPGNFIPRPKVTSTVIRMTPYEKKPVTPKDEKLFFDVIKGCFAQRRKTVKNSLAAYFSDRYTKEETEAFLTSCGISPDARGETLTLSQVCAVSDAMALSGKT